MTRLKDPDAVRKIAKKSLFEGLDHMCEGAIIVDRDARIVWLSDKYAARLEAAVAAEAVGQGGRGRDPQQPDARGGAHRRADACSTSCSSATSPSW